MTTIADRARQEGTPLVDGDTVTFVWLGDHPPQLVGDWNRWGLEGSPLDLVEESPGTWTARLTLAPDAYLEYRFVRDGQTVPDPLNRRPPVPALGDDHEYLWMPGASETALIRSARGRRGKVTRREVTGTYTIARPRCNVWLYEPPYSGPVPLIVVLDGQDYLRRARLATIVDNLIADGRIEPVALAMVQSAGHARHVEYACNDATVGFLKNHVVPLAASHINLSDPTPGTPYAILGASMGGLMSLYAALRLPGLFGKVISQSGAFGTSILHHPLVVDDLVDHLSCSPPGEPASDRCGRPRNQSVDGLRSLRVAVGAQPRYVPAAGESGRECDVHRVQRRPQLDRVAKPHSLRSGINVRSGQGRASVFVVPNRQRITA